MAGNVGYIAGPTLLANIFTVLSALTFPTSAETGRKPTVTFMGTSSDESDEQIDLKGVIKNGDVQWQNTGRIIGEIFTAEIEVSTAVAGVEGPDALTRIIVLTQVIEAGFRDQTTGLPKGLTDTRVVDDYRFQGYELDSYVLSDTGWGMTCTLELRINTRH